MTLPIDLDQVIHAPKRLAIMALLDAAASADFTFLKEHLELSDSDLSKQMTTLRDAGYITVHKSGHGRSGQTTYKITPAGRTAYKRYRRQLADLIGPASAALDEPTPRHGPLSPRRDALGWA